MAIEVDLLHLVEEFKSIPYITLMEFVASPSPFGVKYISMWKINADGFSIH